MGCILCNIFNVKEFDGESGKEKNIFYQATEKEREELVEELAYAIASRHPEMVKKINDYVEKLRKKDMEDKANGNR